MGSLIGKMIVIGLAASVSPVSIMVLISIMLTKNPLKNALSFLLGFTLVLIAYGVIGDLIFRSAKPNNGHLGGYLDIVLGVLCLLAIILVVMRSKKPKAEKTGGSFGAGKAFGVGAATMAVNTSTIIIYIAGVHEVARAKVGTVSSLVAMLVLLFFTLLTMFIPITIYMLFPKKASALLEKLRGWLVKHNTLIATGILVLFGVYLLVKGIMEVLK